MYLRSAGIAVAIVATVPLSVRTEPLQPVKVNVNRRSVETPLVSPIATPVPTGASANFTPLIGQVPPVSVIEGGSPDSKGSNRSNSFGQLTSVSQLSDVKPTDWAFQALQSLVERYGCIVGYPDKTSRGNRATTRYEFAAGLNACLDKIQELIAASTADFVRKEDLETIKKLQEEFAAELAALKGRVEALEVRTATLEKQQFSTTTRLVGQVVVAASAGGFSGDHILDPKGRTVTTNDPNATIIYRAFFDLNTSFTGKDLLKTRIWTGSDGLTDNAAGFLEPNFGSVLDYSARSGVNDQFSIARAVYTFPLLPDLRVSVGPVIAPHDYIDKNRYANLSFLNFSTQLFVNNYILLPINGLGAGGAVDWNPNKGPFSLRAVYLAADASNPDRTNQRTLGVVSPFARLISTNGGNRGFFGDPSETIVELEYAAKAFALRLQYSGGSVFDSSFDVFGANLEWALSKNFGIFGRYGYGRYQDTDFGDLRPNYWMAGFSLTDLFVKGGIAGIAAGQPFITDKVGNGTQTNFEAFYNLPVSDNIRITPVIQVITGAGNQSSNGTIITGTLRTVFSF